MTALRSIVFAMLLSTAALAAPVDQHEGHQATPRQPKVAPQPHPEKVLGWEPIRCWRQSTAGAITIGEPFTVVVTCAVYEGDNAQVIPDESRLGVASIQMAPFEILGGTHPPDVHRGTRRFFQYEYQLRIISPDAIGRDVNVPPLSISYRIHSRVGAAATSGVRRLDGTAAAAAAGILSTNSLPRPGPSLLASTVAPWRSARLRTIVSPRPSMPPLTRYEIWSYS